MLKPNQRKAAELLAYSMDMTKEEIAKECRVSRSTLWKWETQDQEFQEYLQTHILPSIRQAVPGALKSMKYLSTQATQENVRYSASKDILDRAGYKPVDKVQTENKTQQEFLESINNFANKWIDTDETE